MMKKIFLFLLLIISFVSYGQTYNPANFTVSNKSYGVAQAVPTDARSQFYDATNFVMRDYQSTTEVNSYLNLAKYRTGHFLVYIHNGGSLSAGVWTGGTTDIYIYKDGVLDANLVPLFTNTTLSNTGSGFRIVKPISGSDYPLRSLASSNTIIWDSTSNSNSLTGKVDTSLIVTINRLSDTAASIRLAISAGGGGITTLTGDVTASGTGSVAATIANNAVSNAKFRQSAALSVVGRTSNSTGNVADIAAATSGHVLRRNGTTLDFGTIDSVSVPLLHSEAYYNTKYPAIGSDSVYVKSVGDSGLSLFYIQGDTLKLKRINGATQNADSSITIAASGGGGSSVVDYYNIQTAGADSTGATDVSSYIIAGFATGKPVYIPKGTYLVSSAITIPTWGMIIGDGNRSVIKTTSNISVFIGGNYASVQNIKMIGNDGTTSQIGISIDGTGGMQVTNCWFVDLGAAIKVQNTNGFYGVGGLTTTQIIIESSGYGIYALNQGEYINASNFNIRNNTYGIYNGGGNNVFTTGSITDCTYGFYLATGINDGHATASAVKINHCTNTLYASSINNGYKFVGCMFYYGRLNVLSSSNVQFSECDINTTGDSLVVSSAAGTYFRNCNFYGTTNWKVSGTKPVVINDNSQTGGIRFDLAGESKPVDFYTSNGFATFGGSTIQRFLFQKPIFGANGPATYTHDVNVGSFNMDYAVSQALSDPFRVFNPSSSGGTVAAFMANQLASVGYYAMRIMNTGNIAIHQNNATARVHILGSTATANTAPLKFVSGTNMTTPENGAFEYDGSHLYFTPSSATRKKFALMPNSTASTGSLLYGNGTDFSLLSAGSNGQVLTLSGGTPTWADPSAGSGTLTVINDADYTVAAGVTNVVYSNTTAGRTVTLPTASSNTNRIITIKHGGGGAFNLTTSPAYRENISTTASTIAQNKWVTVMSDGTDWYLVSTNN